MKPAIQSGLILGATLVIGFVVGMFFTGALERSRMAQLDNLRERGGFIEHMERVITPRDPSQRTAIRPILEATARRNKDIIASAHESLRSALEDMIAELEPILDPDQYRRISEVGQIADPFRPPPPPPGRGPGGPPPRDGRPSPPPR